MLYIIVYQPTKIAVYQLYTIADPTIHNLMDVHNSWFNSYEATTNHSPSRFPNNLMPKWFAGESKDKVPSETLRPKDLGAQHVGSTINGWFKAPRIKA